MIDVQDDIKGAVITIKIVGIGGGGNNVLRRLAASGFNKSQLLAINTDVRQLKTLDAEGIPCLLIGGALTKGRGTGGNVEKAQNAAISEKDEIAKAIAGADLVFLTAGMGKGVGTGAAPVVAKIAHDMNILTVGMVTLPFSHEGERKMNTAKDGVDLLRQNMDALVVVNNDNIEKLPEFRRITVGETFSTVDEVLRQSIGSIEYMRGNTSALIMCLGEVILSASLLYSNIFSLYIVKRSVCSFWLTFGIKLAMVVSFMMAADKTAGTESVNVIIVLLVIVSSVILILVCRIKYQDKMFSSMADYEYIKKI